MCGRFIQCTSGEALAERFQLSTVPVLTPRYNVAPHQSVGAIRVTSAGHRTFAALRWNGDAVAAPCTIHLHGTDLDDAEWLLRLDADGIVVEQVHAKGDLALRGSISDLELALYARPAAGELQRFGDEAALTTFQRAFTF